MRKKDQLEAQVRLEKWSRFILKYLGYDLSVKGIETIPKGETIYFVSNHQGTLDPALVLASCPVHLAFISKKENETMPIFGRWARNIGTIHFDRESREGNVHMLREAARELKQKKNLLVFPEGTRSKGDTMNEFKAGALLPAYLSKATIVPVALKKLIHWIFHLIILNNLKLNMENRFVLQNIKKSARKILLKNFMTGFKVELIFHQRINDRSIHPLFL